MELCTHEEAVFFLPVNILTVWSPAFLAARHTTVCLDIAHKGLMWEALLVEIIIFFMCTLEPFAAMINNFYDCRLVP